MRNERGIKLNYATGVHTEFLLLFLIVLFTLFHISFGISPVFYLTFLVLIPVLVKCLSAHVLPKTVLFLLLATFFNVVGNTLLSKVAQISFDYFFKMIMYFCTMLYFWSASEMVIDAKSSRWLLFAPILMGTFMIISYYLLGNRTQVAGSITLGFKNSNFAGMWLTHVFFYGVYLFFSQKRVILRILIAGFSLLCLILIWKTYARSCFLGIAFFVVMLLIGKIWKIRKLHPVVIISILLFPLICALFYLYVVNTAWFQNMFSFLVRTGKKIDARYEIWHVALTRIRENPFFGYYSEISNGMGSSQLHNTHIDVLCSYGLLPFILFILSLRYIAERINLRIRNYRQFVAFIAFLSVIVIGSFEAAIVAGSTGLYLLSGGFLLLTTEWDTEKASA